MRLSRMNCFLVGTAAGTVATTVDGPFWLTILLMAPFAALVAFTKPKD